MINKRETKRFNLKFGKFLDPIALFLLIAIFILPALAVINLSPTARNVKNVLGTQSKKDISFVLVGGIHDFLKEENISFPTEGMTKYEAQLIKRDRGIYSKPIIQITNSYGNSSEIEISGGTETPTGSPIFLILNEKEYMLQNSVGVPSVVKINIPKESKNIIYLKFDTLESVKFNENILLNIVQKQ